jgi:serine protease
VQLAVTRPATGSTTTNADFGPIYVLLIDPDTQNVVQTVLAVRAGGRYTWSASGYQLHRVAVVAGGDLDNDDLICQRGEPCGAYPVISPGSNLTTIDLSGNRSDIDFQVAPLSGMSVQNTGAGSAAGWRRR